MELPPNTFPQTKRYFLLDLDSVPARQWRIADPPWAENLRKDCLVAVPGKVYPEPAAAGEGNLGFEIENLGLTAIIISAQRVPNAWRQQ
jgi:hypothetical protein